MDAFPSLPQASRALFVRMVMRKGTLFRASKLSYAEIGCTVEAARHLLPTGWIEHDPVHHPRPVVRPAVQAGNRRRVRPVAARKKRPQGRAAGSPALRLRRRARVLRLVPRFRRRRLQHPGQAAVRPPAPDLLRQPAPGLDRVRAVRPRRLQVRAGRVFAAVARLPQPARHRPLPRTAQLQGTLRGERAARRGAARPCPQAAFENDWLDSRRARLLFQIGQQCERQKDWDNAYARVFALQLSRRARARDPRAGKERAVQAARSTCCRRRSARPKATPNASSCCASRRAWRASWATSSRAARRNPAVARLDLCLPMPQEDWWVEGVVRDHLARADAPVLLRRERADQRAVWPAVLARGLLRDPRRVLPSLPPRPGGPVQRRLLPAPRGAVPRLPRRARHRQLRRNDPPHLRRKARPAVAVRVLGSAQRGADRHRAGLHPGRAPAENRSSASCST